MDKKILIIGYFGYNTNQLDGQTVKTRDILKLVQLQYTKHTIQYYDTQDFKINKLSIMGMFKKLCGCKNLIYLPANNNLKYIFPIVYILSLFFRFKIHYYVVGGWLCNYIRNMPIHKCMLKNITGIHVETEKLKNDLVNKYRFKNVDIFPNFRFFDFIPNHHTSSVLQLVFMARIMKEKGIDWIFYLAQYILDHGLNHKISISFYGPISKSDEEYFLSNISKYDFINYGGTLQPEEIYSTISNYDVLVLPTHFFTEGLPGSIVDAYISGLPVIVTRWMNASEFIDDGKNGFIIPFENGQDKLIECVMKLLNDRDLLSSMQSHALSKRESFAPPSIII